MQNTAIDWQSRPALATRVRLQIDAIDGEPVLLYPEGLMKLNATAHEVVLRCDGRTTVDNIVESLGQEYEVSTETMRADVLECLAQLQQRQLIVFTP
jgi:coenzyme PQQ biosynthesis protein PqqD